MTVDFFAQTMEEVTLPVFNNTTQAHYYGTLRVTLVAGPSLFSVGVGATRARVIPLFHAVIEVRASQIFRRGPPMGCMVGYTALKENTGRSFVCEVQSNSCDWQKPVSEQRDTPLT